MQKVIVIICLTLTKSFFGQGFQVQVDTVKYNHRIGGNLDSIDLISGSNSATFPGGGWNTRSSIIDPSFILHSPGGQLFWSTSEFKPYIYSGLPHLGVAYMFGSNAQQYLRAEFQQMLKSNLMLNIDYEKRASNGILRNSIFNHENVQLKLRRQGRIYSLDLKSSYESSKVEQSGGIVSDSLPDYYSLEFIPVNRSESEVHTQRGIVDLIQYVDFLKDSSRSAGVCILTDYQIKKYRLKENGSLNTIYPLINFDSLITNDLHQWSSIEGGLGLFYSGRKMSARIVPSVNYWNFQNLGRFNDTLEITGKGQLYYLNRHFKLQFNGEYNLRGANYSWKEDLGVNYHVSGIDVSFKSTFYSQLPDYYQRYSIGNSTLPAYGAWDRQNRQVHLLSLSRKWNRILLSTYLQQSLADKNYWFIGSSWRNDTIEKLKFTQAGVSFSYRLKAFNCQLDYRLTQVKYIKRIIPEHQLFGRIYLKGGLFKARKMIAYSGIESGFLSSFSPIGYLPQVASLSLVSSDKQIPCQFLFHYYAGFEIDEFKFFLRLENIQSFWAVKSVQPIIGHPVAPFQIKVGITWDFFD